MHYYVAFAAQADDASHAQNIVENFLDRHPNETDWYSVIDVVPVTEPGQNIVKPDIVNTIKAVMLYKDAEIARLLRAFTPTYASDAVVSALSQPEPDDPFNIKEIFTEALRTQGRSLALHHYQEGFERQMALYSIKRLFCLLDDSFHNEVGFYDIEEYATTDHWMNLRVAEDPQRQWFVSADLHN